MKRAISSWWMWYPWQQKIPFNSLVKNNNSRDDTFNNTHILICNFYR
jgi:hypothetical protein